ncbi:hypothetical protein GCM10027511_16060 [Hymenobacter humi]
MVEVLVGRVALLSDLAVAETVVAAVAAIVRGHEKVPGVGQVEVPAGGQVRSPLVAK